MRRFPPLLITLIVLSLAPVLACSDDDNGNSPGTPETDENGTTFGGPGIIIQDPESSRLPDLIENLQPTVVAVVVMAGGSPAGEGSGVVWDSEGHIVTNNHVVIDATTVEVVLASGERIPATVIGADPLTDLAVLRVEEAGLHPATFSENLPRVGDLVLALGNPLGFESSVTMGIVSGLNRAIPSGGRTPALVDLLQTDAAISPGNSGGALVNVAGEVVGINVAHIPPSAQAVSIGFAIPSVTVRGVVEQLIETGNVEHAFLGIEPRPLTPQIASQLGLGVSEGVLVFGVNSGGPADEGGILPGDVIVDFEGLSITSIEDLYTVLRDTSPGDEVALTVMRDGEEQSLDVTLGSRSGQ